MNLPPSPSPSPNFAPDESAPAAPGADPAAAGEIADVPEGAPMPPDLAGEPAAGPALEKVPAGAGRPEDDPHAGTGLRSVAEDALLALPASFRQKELPETGPFPVAESGLFRLLFKTRSGPAYLAPTDAAKAKGTGSYEVQRALAETRELLEAQITRDVRLEGSLTAWSPERLEEEIARREEAPSQGEAGSQFSLPFEGETGRAEAGGEKPDTYDTDEARRILTSREGRPETEVVFLKRSDGTRRRMHFHYKRSRRGHAYDAGHDLLRVYDLEKEALRTINLRAVLEGSVKGLGGERVEDPKRKRKEAAGSAAEVVETENGGARMEGLY